MLGFSLKVVQFSADCQKNGLCYQGTVSTTVSGRTCQQWKSVYPHAHIYTNLPANYCRNPTGFDQGRNITFSNNNVNIKGVWCYTTNPGKRWEVCPVPEC